MEGIQIHQHGAAGIGDIGDMGPTAGPAGEPPDDPGFHGPEKGLAFIGRTAGRGNVVQDPFDFRTRKIGCDRQPGDITKAVLPLIPAQFLANLIGARALPDNGIHERLAGIFIPEHGGFPLIGDADGGQIRSGNIRFCQGAADDLLRVLPDLKGIMFHPSRLRKDLFVLLLIGSNDLPVMIENDEPVAGRALIQVRPHIWPWFVLLSRELDFLLFKS